MSALVLLCAAVPVLFLALTGIALFWLCRGNVNKPSCARCTYVIRGISSSRCPECGADLSRPGAVLDPTRGLRLPLWQVGIVCATFSLMIVPIPGFTGLVELLPSRATRLQDLSMSPTAMPNRRTRDGIKVAFFQMDGVSRFPWQNRTFGPAEWIAFRVPKGRGGKTRTAYYDYTQQTLKTNSNPAEPIGPLSRDVVEAWLRDADSTLEGPTFVGMVDLLMEFATSRRPPSASSSLASDSGAVMHVFLQPKGSRLSLDSAQRASIATSVSIGWAVICLILGSWTFVRIGRRHRARLGDEPKPSPGAGSGARAGNVARLRGSPMIPVSIVPVSLLAIVTGAYVVGWGRSQGFGFSIANIGHDLLLLCLGSLLFVLPALILIVLTVALTALHALSGARSRWWRLAVNLIAVIVLAIAVPEAWYGTQDYMILQRNRNLPPAAKTGEGRWWPFTNHHVYYDESLGRWVGAC